MIRARTDPEIAARLAKFKSRAKGVVDYGHLEAILQTFPANQRKKVFEAVQPLLGFKAKWPLPKNAIDKFWKKPR